MSCETIESVNVQCDYCGVDELVAVCDYRQARAELKAIGWTHAGAASSYAATDYCPSCTTKVKGEQP